MCGAGRIYIYIYIYIYIIWLLGHATRCCVSHIASGSRRRISSRELDTRLMHAVAQRGGRYPHTNGPTTGGCCISCSWRCGSRAYRSCPARPYLVPFAVLSSGFDFTAARLPSPAQSRPVGTVTARSDCHGPCPGCRAGRGCRPRVQGGPQVWRWQLELLLQPAVRSLQRRCRPLQ